MIPRRTAALAAALLTCGVRGTHADAPEIFRVAVRLSVVRSIAPRVVLPELEDETESLWRPYGVQLDWADAGAADAGAPGLSVDAVVEQSPLSDWVAILGRVTLGRDTPCGPIHVSFDATERVLASRTRSTVRVVRDREMARALGRVLAHEIGHVLLAAPYHDASGLMRARFLPADLAEPERAPFRLTVDDVGRLRSRVRLLTGSASGF
jgi:hypothetical protein